MANDAMLKPSDIVKEVEAVLRGRGSGKGQFPGFVTAYQILEDLSQVTRDRLIQERGMPGQGGGTRYAAASVVMQAAQMIPGIEVSYIETRNLKFVVADQEIRSGYEVCGIYRLQPNAAPPLLDED